MNSPPSARATRRPAAALQPDENEAARRSGPPELRRRRRRGVQYNFFGNCMLRTRLKWRFTAAAFLRLRSEVGFS